VKQSVYEQAAERDEEFCQDCDQKVARRQNKGGNEMGYDKDEMLRALWAVLDPIREHDRKMLRVEAVHLKQKGGEAWAVGEMLERACIHLDACQLIAA